MTYPSGYISDDLNTLPKLPFWVTPGHAETPEDVVFLSGAALSHLHLVVAHAKLPHSLLRARLALRAAVACVAHAGRPEGALELRDAVAFLQPGDLPGPAGDVYLSWLWTVERPVSVKALQRALPGIEPDRIAGWLDGCHPCDGGGPCDKGRLRGAGRVAPIPRAASVLEAVLKDIPRAQTMALLLSDAALAHALGWSHAMPLLALGLKRGDLRKTGDDLRLACHRAITVAAAEATREAAELTRRAARLTSVAPKLRAAGAEEAVGLFLTRDANAPSALTSLRSDRAARRFCDRLVEFGVVRELTGRDTFRLYGV